MASNVDMSLDDILLKNKKGKLGNKLLGKKQAGGGGGVSQNEVVKAKKAEDLRKVIAQKQKASMSDLRTKLKPKALYTSKYVSKHTSITQPNTPAGFETKNFGKSAQFYLKSDASRAQPKTKALARRSDPGPLSSRKLNTSPKLPSYEEAKKITVTVPGTSRSTSTSEYTSDRREERLAAAIARSRELRQDTYMKGREEFLASSITSALRESGGVVSRDRGTIGGAFSRMQPRGYSRSLSPPPIGVDYQNQLPMALPRGTIHAPRGSFSPRIKEGFTTVTSMIIQNLSDTVSKNDVAELCRAVGVLETVHMMAPGVAEVIFKYKDDALEAYKKYNQRNLDGQPMICQLQSTPRAKLSTGGLGHRTLTNAYTDDLYLNPSSGFY